MTSHFSHWMLRLPIFNGLDAVTLGQHVFFRGKSPSLALIEHEKKHTEQYAELGIPRFLAAYTFDYLACRLLRMSHDQAYRNIRLEIEAGPI